jgi:general secretion pathway protein B
MSYILDALRKAERERKLGRVPGIDLNRIGGNEAPSSSRWPVWVALGLILNAAVLGAWYLYQRVDEPPRGELAAAEPEKAPVPEISAPRMASPAVPQIAKATPEAAPAVPETRVADDAKAAPVPSTDPEPTAALAVPKSSPEPQPTAEPEPEPKPKPKPKPAKRRTPKATPPALAEMPAAYRAKVPRLDLSVHVYSDTPSKRFVFINGKQYREGQRLTEGPTLEQIQLRGIVLQYKGERFLLAGRW